MLLGKTAGGFRSSVAFTSYLERLKKPKAVDSIKRVGVTATIRYSEAKGLHCQIGPQWFYYPGQVVMRHLLPMIFSLPALFVTLLGLFLQLDGSLDTADAFSTSPKPADAFSAVAGTAGNFSTASPPYRPTPGTATEFQPISQNRTRSAIKSQKRRATAMGIAATFTSTSSKSNSTVTQGVTDTTLDYFGRKKRKWTYPRGVKFWHNKILKWAGTKSTGLGYNMGWRYQGLHDASLGSRIVFEIQSFYPFPKTLKKLAGRNFTSFFAPYFGGSSGVLAPPIVEPVPPPQQVPIQTLAPESRIKRKSVDMLADSVQ
jgi:hypothetical protein